MFGLILSGFIIVITFDELRIKGCLQLVWLKVYLFFFKLRYSHQIFLSITKFF